MAYTIDTEFMNIVMQASKAFRRISGRLSIAAKNGETKPLIDLLRSKHPIGRGERELIADLLAGQLGSPVGRPLRKFGDRDRRRKAFARYQQLMAQYKAERRPMPRQPLAVDRVVTEFGMTREQVLGLIKDRKMRI